MLVSVVHVFGAGGGFRLNVYDAVRGGKDLFRGIITICAILVCIVTFLGAGSGLSIDLRGDVRELIYRFLLFNNRTAQ
jgi:hypothetical protein